MKGMNNRMFAQKSVLFAKACELADCKPTPRQASKFRNDRRGKSRLCRASAGRALVEQVYKEVAEV